MSEKQIIEITAAIQTELINQNPEALQILLNAIRLEGQIILGIIVFVAIPLIYFGKRVIRWWDWDYAHNPRTGGTQAVVTTRILFTVLYGIVSFAYLIIGSFYIFYVRFWMTLLDPKLAMAHDITKRVLSVWVAPK